MGTVGYNPSLTENDSGLIRIEASQKGWLLVRALADLMRMITYLLASPDHDWQNYDIAKSNVLRALEIFERWYGR